MIILDTNVLSELMKPSPSARVVAWIEAQPAHSLFTTSITQSEILYGVMMLPAGRRRQALEAAADAVFRKDFAGRVLSFGSDAALPYARIAVDRRRTGRPISQSDAQIAAIALCTGATVVTRNVTDFENCGVDLVNPWEA
jgi:predicted nucleic acid-binding protein